MEIFVQNIYDLKNIDDIVKELPKDRYARYVKFRKEEDKLACVLAYHLIREHIGGGEILKNEFGKPYIKDSFPFNISHSGEYVILAKNDTQIGCDIEKIVDIDVKQMAEYSFYKKEIEYLKNKNYDLKTFYRFWTIKESYLKMLGLGISKGLDSFFVDLENLTINGQNDYKITLKEDLPNYIIAAVSC